LYMFLYMCA